MKKSILLITLLLFFAGCTTTKKSAAETSSEIVFQKEPQTPEEELQALKDGNNRFLANEGHVHDFHYQIDTTKDGQKPYAVILSCLDSRIPPEVIFDQGIGQIFVARVAGNIQNSDILGSLEFATAVAGAKLIVVLGHTKCGAIKGACQDAKLGHLTSLLKKIQPAVRKVKRSTPNFDPDLYDHVDHVSEENVKMTVNQIRSRSKVIRDLEAKNQVRIVGAMYDISSGKVTFQE